MKDKLARAEFKAALAAAGCIDPDVAIKLAGTDGITVSDAGDVDAETVKAAVGALKAGRSYLFVAPAAQTKDEQGSVRDMSRSEYQQAKRALKVEAGNQERTMRGGGEPDLAAVAAAGSAFDMKPEEYRAARRNLTHGGLASFGAQRRTGDAPIRPGKNASLGAWATLGQRASRPRV